MMRAVFRGATWARGQAAGAGGNARLAVQLVRRSPSGLVATRRWASSGSKVVGEGMGPRSSDMPWMIGAAALTVPAVLYLLSGDSPAKHHAHDVKEKVTHGEGDEQVSEATDEQVGHDAPTPGQEAAQTENEPNEPDETGSGDNQDHAGNEGSGDETQGGEEGKGGSRAPQESPQPQEDPDVKKNTLPEDREETAKPEKKKSSTQATNEGIKVGDSLIVRLTTSQYIEPRILLHRVIAPKKRAAQSIRRIQSQVKNDVSEHIIILLDLSFLSF